MIKTCRDCGKEFEAVRRNVRCPTCLGILKKKAEEIRNRPILKKNCVICGSPFETKMAKRILCGKIECQRERYNYLQTTLKEKRRKLEGIEEDSPRKRICLFCKKTTVSDYGRDAFSVQFCSNSCKTNYLNMASHLYTLDSEIRDREMKKLNEKGFRYVRPNTVSLNSIRKRLKIKEVEKEEPKEEVRLPNPYFLEVDSEEVEPEEEPELDDLEPEEPEQDIEYEPEIEVDE